MIVSQIWFKWSVIALGCFGFRKSVLENQLPVNDFGWFLMILKLSPTKSVARTWSKCLLLVLKCIVVAKWFLWLTLLPDKNVRGHGTIMRNDYQPITLCNARHSGWMQFYSIINIIIFIINIIPYRVSKQKLLDMLVLNIIFKFQKIEIKECKNWSTFNIYGHIARGGDYSHGRVVVCIIENNCDNPPCCQSGTMTTQELGIS